MSSGDHDKLTTMGKDREETLKAIEELIARTEARLAKQAPEVEETRRELERVWKLLEDLRPA